MRETPERMEGAWPPQGPARSPLGQHLRILLLLLPAFTRASPADGCGRRASSAPTNATQEAAALGELPWVVRLRDGGSHVALGAILGPDWILSAASSFHGRTQVSALTGASRANGGSLVPIQAIVPHQAFDEISLEHDLALLRTGTPLSLSAAVQPACFPAPDFPGAALRRCLLAGQLDPAGAGPLRTLSVEDVDPCPLHRTVSTECCSHREGDRAPGCLGSAGNPVLCEAEGRWVLKGLLSRGGARCYGPFLYSRLLYYSDWIVATTAKWGAPASPLPGQSSPALGGPAEEEEGLLFEPFLELRALNASGASEDALGPSLPEEPEEDGRGLPEGRASLPLYYDYYGGELLAWSSAEPGGPWGPLCMGLLLRLLAG